MSAKQSRKARALAYSHATDMQLWNELKSEAPRSFFRRLFDLPASNRVVAELYKRNIDNWAHEARYYIRDIQAQKREHAERKRMEAAMRKARYKRFISHATKPQGGT
jgi:hypothetical protein